MRRRFASSFFLQCFVYFVCLSLFTLCIITSCCSSFRTRVTFHLRIANRMVKGSCCRGGIVNTRFGCCRALLQRRHRPKALWRFRASTSNSLSDLSRPHIHMKVRGIHQNYAQQDIRVCGDDHFESLSWQSKNPKALSLLHVSI